MNKTLTSIVALFLGLTQLSYATDAGSDVARELGAVLAWRLGPEAFEERCRIADPDGAEARASALMVWQQKNESRIKAVDARVAEVVPLLRAPADGKDPVLAVRAQVKQLFLEGQFSGKSPDEVAALCKAETNAASARWNSNGMPHVQQSLAALYDWKVSQGGK